MNYAVILAGGTGKRLWPMSRKAFPKQLLPLLDGKSLLSVTLERLQGLFPPERILIVTSHEFADQIHELTPELPRKNILAEPCQRNTAAAIAYAAEWIASRSPQATMSIFTSDHLIQPQEKFLATIQKALSTVEAHPKALVTFGIRPTWAHTGLGYIQVGESITEGVHRSKRFCEKPDSDRAQHYVESGDYVWNSGMFAWKVETFLQILKTYLPDTAAGFSPVRACMDQGIAHETTLGEVYPKMEKISVDYAVLENAKEVLVVDLPCRWLDLGSWPALADLREQDDAGNTILAERYALRTSSGNVIVNDNPDHLVGVFGMDNAVIIHSGNATLVCSKEASLELQQFVDQIHDEFQGDFC